VAPQVVMPSWTLPSRKGDIKVFLQVTTTIDSLEGARALARSAVQARLAACAQISGPIESVYRWQGEIEQAQEWVVVYKAPAAGYPRLEAHIREHHSYDVPEILATAVSQGNPAYLSWVEENAS
jgi:periplasmic divalent cation tolerance protein